MFSIEEINSIINKGLTNLNWAKEPKELYQPLEYMIAIGGKRIRPKFCLATYNLFSNAINNAILLPALALEVFHSFTLIHDDIMDNADLRRGQPTVHKRWNDNIAILSGDAMCIYSYSLLSNAPAGKLKDVLSLFSKTAMQVCEGQQFDMNFEYLPFITLEDYISMIGLKTAVLIACSAKMGAIIAGAPKDVCDGLYDFGYKLGTAFQIQDDYLDSFGDENVFGKKIGGDILNNKKTWLLTECFKLADQEQTKRLKKLLAMKESSGEEKISKMREFFKELGIDIKTKEAISVYYKKALDSLGQLNLTPEQKGQMEQYARTLIVRNF